MYKSLVLLSELEDLVECVDELKPISELTGDLEYGYDETTKTLVFDDEEEVEYAYDLVIGNKNAYIKYEGILDDYYNPTYSVFIRYDNKGNIINKEILIYYIDNDSEIIIIVDADGWTIDY